MNTWVRRLSLIVMLAVLALPLSWCARNIWYGWTFTQLDRAAQERYPVEYQALLELADQQLIAELIEVRGEPLTPMRVGQTQPFPGTFSTDDPTLAWLLDNPAELARLELHPPRVFESVEHVRTALGPRRFWSSDDLMRTESIEPWPSDDPLVRGPHFDADTLAQAIVLREGSGGRDWLLHLPGHASCQWLYVEMDVQCMPTMKSWLASSIVGLTSRWARIEPDLEALLAEMTTLLNRPLAEALTELRDYQPGVWDMQPRMEDPEQVAAYPGWAEVLEEIDAIRPPPVLSLDQTYRAERAFSLHTALIWRWDGTAFQPIRLKPHDYEKAVVVVSEPFGRERVVQVIDDDGAIIYVDLKARLAFDSFHAWVDWARAKERLYKRRIRTPAPNAARYPIG